MKLIDLLNEDFQGKLALLLPRYISIGKTQKYAKARLIELNKLDPSGNAEYLPWIVRLDLEKSAKMGKEFNYEDDGKIKEILDLFTKIKRKPDITDVNKDINFYKTFGDLAKAISKYKEAPEETLATKGEIERGKVTEGAKEIYNDGTYKIVEISTPEAASDMCRYSIDATKEGHWCIKDPKFSVSYLKNGNLYLIYKNGVKYVLAHRDDIKDVYDNDLKKDQMMEIIDLLIKSKLIDKVGYNFLIQASKIGDLELIKKIYPPKKQ